MTVEKAINQIQKYLDEIDDLLKEKYWEGEERGRRLDIRIKHFIKSNLKESASKVRDYNESLYLVSIVRKRDGDRDKAIQEAYENTLKTMETYLTAFKEELELQQEVGEKESGLKSLEGKLKKQKLEKERREEVLESKLLGASIEMVDLMRNELKNREEVAKSLIEMRKELSEIKRKVDDIQSTVWM